MKIHSARGTGNNSQVKGNFHLLWHMNCACIEKLFMAKDHKDKPSGLNKNEGLGLKPVIATENLEGSDEMEKKYTKNENDLSENVKEKHPNRNRSKGNATNTGGY